MIPVRKSSWIGVPGFVSLGLCAILLPQLETTGNASYLSSDQLSTGVSPTCEATNTGRCWYVAADGNDTNPGTFEAPFKKPHKATEQAGPGDFIYLRGGIYSFEHAESDNVLFQSHRRGQDGQPGALVTFKSYPGEQAIIRGSEDQNIHVLVQRSYWRIEGLKIEYGRIGVAVPFVSGVHHVWIVGNEISGWFNPTGNSGLIKVDGNVRVEPSNIYIWNNKVHDHFGEGRLTWEEDPDIEHHACIMINQGGGPIEIIGNELYNCPSIFYFKYHWSGPIVMEDNRLHDARGIGNWRSSNNHFRNNIVYDIGAGVRTGVESSANVYENNTWIGLKYVVNLDNLGGHTLRDNVVFGPGYLVRGSVRGSSRGSQREPRESSRGRSQRSQSADASGDLSTSDSDSNCFLTPANFRAFSHVTGRDAITLSGLQVRYGLDLSSVQFAATDPASVFADPASGDYTLVGEMAELCEGDGVQTAAKRLRPSE